MTIKEKINDLKLLFNVIKWYKENKNIFVNISKTFRNLQSQVNQLRESVSELKADKAVEGK